MAINTEGVLGWELYEKGCIDTDRLIEFLEKFITTKYKNKLIILDNSSSHRNERIRDLINIIKCYMLFLISILQTP